MQYQTEGWKIRLTKKNRTFAKFPLSTCTRLVFSFVLCWAHRNKLGWCAGPQCQIRCRCSLCTWARGTYWQKTGCASTFNLRLGHRQDLDWIEVLFGCRSPASNPFWWSLQHVQLGSEFHVGLGSEWSISICCTAKWSWPKALRAFRSSPWWVLASQRIVLTHLPWHVSLLASPQVTHYTGSNYTQYLCMVCACQCFTNWELIQEM